MTRLPTLDRDALQLAKAAAFDAAPEPSLVVDEAGLITAMNEAAETLLGQSVARLARGGLRRGLPPDSGLTTLLDRCLAERGPVRERGVEVAVLGFAPFTADVSVSPVSERAMLVTLRKRGSAPVTDRITDSASQRSAAGLGQMLAHEIKNPLAGIRGAAQLLRSGASAEDIPLAQLIMDETDRIRRLVDRMEAFAEDAPPKRAPVNIHQVLDRVRALAANGVADGLTMREIYDPSLPPAWGEEDQLIQVFLNLAKNAAEAAHARGDGRGEITVTTAYRHGVRIRGREGRAVQSAPLEVRVMDNGPGVPAALRDHLFEPFVTTKSAGAGLGLAVVAKLVAGHGGLIDFESEAGRTVFRVLLPVAPSAAL